MLITIVLTQEDPVLPSRNHHHTQKGQNRRLLKLSCGEAGVGIPMILHSSFPQLRSVEFIFNEFFFLTQHGVNSDQMCERMSENQ